MDTRQTRPHTRRVVGWAIGSALSSAVMLIGCGVLLWNVSHDSRSPATSLGATVLVIGVIAAAVTSVGGWLVSRTQGGNPTGGGP
jgi:hypothetical protein